MPLLPAIPAILYSITQGAVSNVFIDNVQKLFIQELIPVAYEQLESFCGQHLHSVKNLEELQRKISYCSNMQSPYFTPTFPTILIPAHQEPRKINQNCDNFQPHTSNCLQEQKNLKIYKEKLEKNINFRKKLEYAGYAKDIAQFAFSAQAAGIKNLRKLLIDKGKDVLTDQVSQQITKPFAADTKHPYKDLEELCGPLFRNIEHFHDIHDRHDTCIQHHICGQAIQNDDNDCEELHILRQEIQEMEKIIYT